LAKANAKAQEKQQKRATDEGKEVRKRPEKMAAVASQAMNRRGVKEDGSGGTKDVRLEGVDISIGTKQILRGAELLLVYGHKYGKNEMLDTFL
jgi:ATP-binding cassette subfamily F protein 3